ncbi:DeoR family transcriptional regulator [Corticicoccus populi]|uniref:DeoR family transcriptional regulator n=1 Tax=Corticicoccus populi TaxID=1812821 RepID=A0ABW5WZS6_9STAP
MVKTKRQEKIYNLIEEQKEITIKKLSQRFSVSEMTIHRDLKLLIDEGLVKKIFGGVQLSEASADVQQNQCAFCQKSITVEGKLNYQLILSNNKIENTCCAHCGILRQKQIEDKVVQALCHDFITHTTISPFSAWFVMDTGIHLGCCEPQVLAFGNKDYAEKFVKGFGGVILSFEEVSKRLEGEMDISCCSNVDKHNQSNSKNK